MRNILQYPITLKEKIDTLTKIKEDILTEYRNLLVCGDMKAEIIQEVINDIKRLYNEKVRSGDE